VRVELWALALALPLGQITTLALPAVVPALREDLGLAYVELGLVIASFGIARLVMNLPAGELAQRFNPRTVLLASLAASLAASLLGQFATTAGMVTVSRLGQGAASAATQAVVLSWLLGGSPPAFRGRAMAISEASFSVFALAVPALTGLLATTTLSWRAAFLLGVLASLVGLAIVAFGTSAASASHAYGQVSGGAAAGRWRNLRAGGVLLLAACVSAFAVFYGRNGLVGSVLPLVAGEQLGLPSLSLGIALSVQAVVSTAAVMAGGWAADRVGRRRLL
jgi:MFS family permease